MGINKPAKMHIHGSDGFGKPSPTAWKRVKGFYAEREPA